MVSNGQRRLFYIARYIKAIMLSRYLPRKDRKDPVTGISKGASEVLKIDKEEIGRTIKQLSDNKDVLITQCEGSLRKSLETIRNYVTQFHKTSAYEEFYQLVIEQFKNVTEVLPGTIAAFCIGSYAYKGGVDDKRYAATCVDSIPLPNEDLAMQYSSMVVLLCNNAGSLICIPLTSGNRSHPGYFYLMGDLPYPKRAEIENVIKNFGIKSYRLYSYDGSNYNDLSKGLVKLTDTTLRLGSPVHQTNDSDCSSVETARSRRSVRPRHYKGENNGYVGLVIGLIVLFILIIVLAALAAKGKK